MKKHLYIWKILFSCWSVTTYLVPCVQAGGLFEKPMAMVFCDPQRTGDIRQFKAILVDLYEGEMARAGDPVEHIWDDVESVCGGWVKKHIVTDEGETALDIGLSSYSAVSWGLETKGLLSFLMAKMGVASLGLGASVALSFGLPLVVGVGAGLSAYQFWKTISQDYKMIYYAFGGNFTQCKDGHNQGTNLPSGMSCGKENFEQDFVPLEILN